MVLRDDAAVLELSRVGDLVGARMFGPAGLVRVGTGVRGVAEAS